MKKYCLVRRDLVRNHKGVVQMVRNIWPVHVACDHISMSLSQEKLQTQADKLNSTNHIPTIDYVVCEGLFEDL